MRWLSLSLIIILCACASRVSRLETIPSDLLGRYYFVKKGDTLWEISQKTGVSIEKLMKANNIASANDLKVDQRLFIPYPTHLKNLATFSWPMEGKIVNFFGDNVDNVINQGLNIKSKYGEEVKAAASGQVIFSDYLKGWSRILILKHSQDIYTVYANLNEISLPDGAYAKKGQAVAKAAQSPQGDYILHFEIRRRNLPQDPLQYLPRPF